MFPGGSVDLPEVQGWSPIRIIGPGRQLSVVGPSEAERPEMAPGPLQTQSFLPISLLPYFLYPETYIPSLPPPQLLTLPHFHVSMRMGLKRRVYVI